MVGPFSILPQGLSSLALRVLNLYALKTPRIRRAMVARTFQPFGDRVVIKPVEREEVSAGGILLPDTAQEKPQEGEVVAVGPGRTADDGKRIAMDSKVGDLVFYARYAGSEVKEDGKEYLIMRETDILAKIS
jgi:chaperonin GroES